MDVGDLEARGLYDPAAPDAADRLALLRYLGEMGVTPDEMVVAEAEGLLTTVASDVLLQAGPPELTLEELAERIEMAPDLAARIWRAAGFPELEPGLPAFPESAVATFEAFGVGAALFGEDVTLRFTRVLGSAMALVADAAVGAFLVNTLAPLAEAGAGDLAIARANVDAVRSVEAVPLVMEALFRSHLEHAVARARLARGDSEAYEVAHLAVGFVDLVGFTALAQQLSNRELAAAVADFDAIASDVIAMQEGRLVKLIGDEAMFVANDPVAACEIAVAVRDAVDRHPVLRSARGGVALGGLVRRDGDYYGPWVNAAARAVNLADPGIVLVTCEVRDAVEPLSDAYRFTSTGARHLRGFDAPVELFELERS